MRSANPSNSSDNTCLWASMGKLGSFLVGLPFIVGGLVPNLDFLLPMQMSTGGTAIIKREEGAQISNQKPYPNHYFGPSDPIRKASLLKVMGWNYHSYPNYWIMKH
ncbi:hypothetical protein L3X38_008650 [Prunus dulcis]|uniref:Uncharacterized protein n=1 Tax=Prunus dulcis TaxID=3755 RepID=A0AAD4ZWW0_PRUDU|nr:hypothetical protein L3X38_008650 [Prunus dulcis]